MKRPALLLTPLLLAACAAPIPSGPRCDGRMTLRNASGQEVEQFYVNAGRDWGRDLLAPATLPAGGSRVVQAVPGRANAFRVVFGDGRAVEIAALDPCETPVLTVAAGGGLRASAP